MAAVGFKRSATCADRRARCGQSRGYPPPPARRHFGPAAAETPVASPDPVAGGYDIAQRSFPSAVAVADIHRHDDLYAPRASVGGQRRHHLDQLAFIDIGAARCIALSTASGMTEGREWRYERPGASLFCFVMILAAVLKMRDRGTVGRSLLPGRPGSTRDRTLGKVRPAPPFPRAQAPLPVLPDLRDGLPCLRGFRTRDPTAQKDQAPV